MVSRTFSAGSSALWVMISRTAVIISSWQVARIGNIQAQIPGQAIEPVILRFCTDFLKFCFTGLQNL